MRFTLEKPELMASTAFSCIWVLIKQGETILWSRPTTAWLNMKLLVYQNNNVNFGTIRPVLYKKTQETCKYLLSCKISQRRKIRKTSESFSQKRPIKIGTCSTLLNSVFESLPSFNIKTSLTNQQHKPRNKLWQVDKINNLPYGLISDFCLIWVQS